VTWVTTSGERVAVKMGTDPVAGDPVLVGIIATVGSVVDPGVIDASTKVG